MYAELSYFDGYHFQHIAKMLDSKRDAMLAERRNQLGRQFVNEERNARTPKAFGSTLR